MDLRDSILKYLLKCIDRQINNKDTLDFKNFLFEIKKVPFVSKIIFVF